MKRAAGPVLMVMIAALVSACGSDPLAFAGNSSCPVAGANGAADATAYSPSPPDTNGDPVGEAIPEMPHSHVAPPATVKYTHNPPTSGCHYSLGAPNPSPVKYGVYTQSIAPEYWVHNLEHGYVMVLYKCATGTDCASNPDVAKLNAWFKKLPADPQGQSCSPKVPYAKVVVMPAADLPVPYAAVSWDYYDGMKSFDLNEIQRFYDNHNGHSPEGVCSG